MLYYTAAEDCQQKTTFLQKVTFQEPVCPTCCFKWKEKGSTMIYKIFKLKESLQ
jgi:hypothetical protein